VRWSIRVLPKNPAKPRNLFIRAQPLAMADTEFKLTAAPCFCATPARRKKRRLPPISLCQFTSTPRRVVCAATFGNLMNMFMDSFSLRI